MRVAQAVELTEEDRRKLEQQSRGRSIAARVVLRSRIILLAAAGLQNKQIAEKLKVAPRMATLWRDRYNKLGIKGLLKDAPRPGPDTRRRSQRSDRILDRQDHPKHTCQRHALVHAHHGKADGHLQGFGFASLAGSWTEAASRHEFQGQQRSPVRGKARRCSGTLSQPSRTRAGVVGG